MPKTDTDLKNHKKSRVKKILFWLLVDLLVAIAVFTLLLYKPNRYKPIGSGSGDYEPGQVSPYLTHDISPKIYNGAQRGEPFELVITQYGINDVISRANWPIQSEGILLYAPAALFVPNTVVLMATVNVKGVEFVITVELEPKIDEKEFLNLQVAKVKVGAMNITPLAKMMAKKMYAERLAAFHINTGAWQTKIAASLLNDEPFEPVFKIDGKEVRVEKITVSQGELIARLAPVSKHGS